jgi:gliding motility-associated-like protein
LKNKFLNLKFLDKLKLRDGLISFVLLFISPFLLSQTNYYVAKNGSNSNSGTSISSPFLTISHAVSQINPGDKIYIRRGTYHEEIIIDNIDSTSGNETLISNYNNEQVIIDGTIAINGSWIDGTIGGVAVKKIENFSESISQLFVGNKQMVMARWPNAQFDDLSIYDHDNWAHGEETGSTDGSFLIDESYDDPGSLSLANSIGILNVGSFRTFNREIATHIQQAGDDVITYTTPIGENGLGAALSDNGELKDKHHYFFFEGKKEFIDVENEWFLDTTNDELYLYPSNGVDLFQTPIRGKIRDYSITIAGSEYLKINGLTFFATTIHARGSNNLEFSECNFYYPSHSKRMLGDLSGANATTFGTGSGNTARVDSSTVSGCLFIDTEGEALIIRGDNNTIKNSYFRNIDWSATELNGLMVSVFIDGTGNTFTGNEIYHTGASATVWPGEQSIFSYNIVSSTGHAQSDGSVFQGTKNYVFGSEVHHNLVYDTEKYAFRYDAPGGDAAQAGSFGVMHHNIADNTLGLMIKGNNQIIAHNTVINTINNRNDIIILAEDCSNTNTWLYNNLAGRIGSHRSDVLFSAPSNGPIPIGTEGYIENGDDWEICDSNDGALYSGTGTGSSTGNMDSINVSRPGIGYNSNIENLINYNPGNGKTISDYQPISNEIIDQGVSLTNTVSTSLTESDQLNSIVPHNPVGSGTDIGAIDGNSLWTPGVQGWTPQQSINLEDIFYNPGIIESNLLLHFDFANSTSYSGFGNQVYDLSNNYFHGELYGNPSMVNNHGGEIDLDGTDDYIQLNDPFSLQDHSIEMWIKMKDNGNDFLWDARDDNDDGYVLHYNSGYKYHINNEVIENSESHLNQWVQVVASYNGEKSRIFINGQKVEQSNSINKFINTTTNARIGARSHTSPDYHLKAEIGIVRFYNQTLYSADVLQNYNANAARFGLTSTPVSPTSIDITQPIPTRGLQLYLDSTKSDSYQSGSNTWFDLSGNDYDFTVSGTPPFDSSINGGVINFQAGGDYATNNSDPILNVNSYTKFAVFKPTAATANNIISGSNNSKHAFYMAAKTNRFQAGHNLSWAWVKDEPNGGASILNIWNIGAVTFDTDSGMDLYYGGNLVDSNSSTKDAVEQTSPRVYIARYNTDNYFTGYIPVAIIYDRKLSKYEVNSISNHFASRYGLSYSNTSSLTIDEGVPINSILADLSATDPDSTQFIYELVSGDGVNDQHNSSFTISGTQIVVGQIISFDNTPLMNINLKVTDESNNSLTQSFVIYVNDLNRAPTDIGISSTTFLESVSASSTIATLSAVDSDTSDSHVFSLINGDGSNDADNSSFTISGTSLIINSTADYETKTSYNLYININDGVNDFAKAFTVSVTDVNDEPPSDIFFLDVDTNNLVLYLNAKNSDSYPTTGNKWFDLSGNYNHGEINGATYNSSADGGFSFDGTNDEIVIQHNSSLNFENNLTLIYTLKPDWSNSSYSPGFSKGENENSNFSTWIGIDKQIDISTQVGNNQTENVNSLRPAYDATNDISAGNWYTIAITIDSSNNQKTYINGSQVGATKSITLVATNSLDLTIGQLPGFSHSTYGGGEIGKVILYNSALTSAQVSSNFNLMSNSSTPTSTYASINEGTALNTIVGSFTATDSDTSIFTFSIVQGDGNNDQHNSYFTISGNQLLVNNGNINYDLTPKLFVNIQVSDGLQTYSKPFEVVVNDLNRAPSDIGLSSNTISESVSASSTIATLSAVDSDTSDTHVFTLTNGDGSNDSDNSSFTISGTSLIINSTADYETKTSYNLYINVNDGANDFAKAFTISVTNINEAPSDLGFLTIPTNGLILHLDASNSNSYPGNGNTWFDLSGQNAHAEATTLPPFGLNGDQINNFDFNANSHGFNSIDLSQEYRDLIVIKKLETGGGIKTVFGQYDFQDDSFRINQSEVKVENSFDANDWQYGSTSDVFVNGSFITQDTNVLDRWVFVRTYRSNNSGFGNSFRYEISKGHGGGSRSYRGKINLILAYNRKLTNQEVQDIYQSLSPRLSGNQTSFTVSSTSSQTSIDEEVSIGTVVGTLTAIDSDTTNLTFSLVSGNGTNDQHNSLFTVSGTLLTVAGNIDYETNSTLNIYVQVSDGENTYQKAMIVNVNDVKETPSIQVSNVVKTFGDENFDLTATSSSTGAFTFNILDTNIATVTGSTTTIVGVGSTSITVIQAEDNNFTSATATLTLTVNKANPTIIFDDLTKTYGDANFNLVATSSSTGAFTFNILDTNVATVTGSTTTIVGAGTTTVTVTQSADSNYNAATATLTLTVNKLDPAITFDDLTKTYGDANFNLVATSSSTGAFTFNILDANVATVNVSNTTIVGAGTTTVTVTQAADSNYNAATATMTLTVNKSDHTITFDDLTKTYEDPEFNLVATSSSTGAFTFNIIDGNVATVTGSNTTIVGAGTTTVTLTQAADSNYNAATATMTLTVNKADPSIIFNDVIATYGQVDFDLTSTSSSTGALTYNILNANVATLSDKTVTIAGAGSTTVTLNQAADSNYNAATATMTLTVNKVYPLITFDDITKIYGDAAFFLTATSSSTAAFTYNIIDTNVATVTGSSTTIVGTGSTLVTVSQVENSNYNAATATMTLTVNQSDPTITFNDENKTFTDPDFNLTATSSSTGVFNYNILDNNIATVSGNTVTIIGAGTTSVTVTQSADSNYNAATATMTLTVNKADPGIGNFNNINKTYGDSDFQIIEPSKNNLNNSNFIYSSSDSNIASISGNTISIKQAGSVVINASLPSDNNFNASVVSATLNINKASQSISIGSLPTTVPLKDFNSISLTASSTSGTPVSIILANGSAASLNGAPGNYNLESIQQTGLVTITYYVDENSSINYSSATVTLVVDVVKVNQNISFNSSPTSNFEYSENLSIPIDASASSSLTLSYNLISGNASLNSNIISVNGTGQIIVELSQIGNNEFNAAPPLNYSVNIGQGTTLLSGFSVPSKYEDDIPFQVTPPTSNRLGEIVYSSSNLQIATISGTVIRILNDGQTIITANQIANNNYRSATISTVFIVNEAIIPDSDNDGVDDQNDNCITNFNPLQEDYDNDNIGNICDNDDDNDGYLDSNDEFPLNPNEWSDYDKDGLGDNQDNDDDNDNWPDSIEISCNTNPLDNSSYPGDYDGDLIPNCEDQDDDNDGYLDDQDEFPENELEWKDNDQDGIGDNEDQDDDQDGYTDNDESSCNSDPLDPDSTPDDFDQDFIPNCTDLDDDNDGCLDNEDTFPLDYYECLDSDNDGIGDNADNDDDNDGVSDSQDAFPFDPTEQKDTDGDGIGDNSDTDYNSDGLTDDVVFPSQFFSPNGDGVNDTWKVVNTNLFPNCEVWIYTRSGELIYNKKGYTNDWAGLLNGEPLPEASYVYMVDPDGDGAIDLKGWIYLTR